MMSHVETVITFRVVSDPITALILRCCLHILHCSKPFVTNSLYEIVTSQDLNILQARHDVYRVWGCILSQRYEETMSSCKADGGIGQNLTAADSPNFLLNLVESECSQYLFRGKLCEWLSKGRQIGPCFPADISLPVAFV